MNFVVAGIGGQGVVYATKVISQAGLLRGASVMASENHGMSQRGGSVMSHVKIGSSAAPLIRRGAADALVAFDHNEALRNLTYVRAGGSVFLNSALSFEAGVQTRLTELQINTYMCQTEPLLKHLGSATVLNLLVLGFAAAHESFGLGLADLQNAVQALGPAKAVELNLRALALGASQK